jgi:glyoxylase I family protein
MVMFEGVAYTALSVRDCERSAKWWSELLDLTEIDRVTGDGWRGIVLMHPQSRTILGFRQHVENRRERFDPRRTGFDHLGFRVNSRASLDQWLKRFEQLGVDHGEIAELERGLVLTFKDPDGIQFEIFLDTETPSA